MNTKFKSVRKIEVKHDRGTDFIQTEGKVIKIENDMVYLKGLSYYFSISKSDFLNYNLYKEI
jgi:hypothetical protein